MQKSAAEILAVLDRKTLDYHQMSAQKARDCCKILEKVLNSSVFRSDLALDFLKMKDGRPVFSNYPRWAFEVAYYLDDPNQEYGKEGKVGLANLCRELVGEFRSDDRFFAEAISNDPDAPRFLVQTARALLAD